MEKVARTADKIHSWREIRGHGTRLSRRKPRGPNFDFRQRVGRTPKLGSRTIRVEDCLRCLFGLPWGIGSSNPSPSTGESAANLTSRKRNIKEFKRNDFRRTALVWAFGPFAIPVTGPRSTARSILVGCVLPSSSSALPRHRARNQVRSRLPAGAKRIRTLGPTRVRRPRQPQGSLLTPRWREVDSNSRSR